MKTRKLLVGAALCAGIALVTFAATAAVEANLDRTFQVQPGGKLVIQADRGSIKVETTPSDTVHVLVSREVKGGSKKDADELLANHEVTFTQNGNEITLTARNKRTKMLSWGRQPWLDVHYEVSVPRKFNVDFRTAGGSIDIAALDGDASAQTTSGSINLPNVTGEIDARDAGGSISIGVAGRTVKARTTSGSIVVDKAGGAVELTDAGGNIRLDEAGGDVVARTTSGNIALGKLGGSAKVTNAGGGIKLETAGGDVEATTTSGSIEIGVVKGRSVQVRNAGGNVTVREAAGAVEASTTSGSIHIENARGRIQAGDAGGNIRIGQAGAEADLHTTSGNINVERVNGNLTAKNAGGGIHVASAHAAVSAETTSGNIDVTFLTTPKSDCRLSVAGGGVSASLPGSAAVNVDAKATGGSVHSDLPVTVVVQGRPSTGALVGKINGGGPLLTLRSTAGNIHLKQSTATQAPVKVEDDAK